MTDSPICVASFADGVTSRMTTWHAPERKTFDLTRGIKLARHAYRSRTGKEPPAIVAAHFRDRRRRLGKIRHEANRGGGVMTNDIVRDCELRDLIAQLDGAYEALDGTYDLINDGDPNSVEVITMNNIGVALTALAAVTSYLANLRATRHA